MNRSLDLGKAFIHLFEDPEWFTKSPVGGLLMLVPVLNFAVVGYEVRIGRNISRGNATPLLRWVELTGLFADGLGLNLARLLLTLPIFALIFAPLSLMLVAPFLPLVFLAEPSGTIDPEPFATVVVLIVVGVSLLSALTLLYSLGYSVVSPAITANYARLGTFAACFEVKEIFRFIRKYAGNYVLAWLVCSPAGYSPPSCCLSISSHVSAGSCSCRWAGWVASGL